MTRHRGCGEELDDTGNCRCSRARLAATKAATGGIPDAYAAALVEHRRALGIPEPQPAAATGGHEPPDAYAATIAAKRAARGLPPLPAARPAEPIHVPRFPLAGRPAADPYKAGIAAHRRWRGIEAPQGLPDDYDPGRPPDPYRAAIRARRRALGLEVAS